MSAGSAKRHEIVKGRGCRPADPSEIKLRVLPSYTFVAISHVEQGVQQMLPAEAEAVPEAGPVYNMTTAKRQASITSYFRKNAPPPVLRRARFRFKEEKGGNTGSLCLDKPVLPRTIDHGTHVAQKPTLPLKTMTNIKHFSACAQLGYHCP